MQSPPKLLLRLLEAFCPPSRQDLKGDFLELYEERVEQLGTGRANWKFFLDALTVLPLRFLVKEKYTSGSSIPMFTHYLKIAFRNLDKSKVYSIINILGLAVGMAVCLLIYQYISFELSYDRFYGNFQNTYRLTQTIIRNGEKIDSGIFTTKSLGPQGKEDIPEVKNFVRVYPQDVGLIFINPENNERHQEDEMWYVDSTFLSIFDFSLKYGDRKSALHEMHNIVITEPVAIKYFGETNPIGKALRVSGGTLSGDFVVAGVLNTLPINSHLQFDFLLPMEFLIDRYKPMGLDSGWDWAKYVTYITTDATTGAEKIAAKFDQLIATYASNELSRLNEKWETGLQPVADIHLRSGFSHDLATNNGDFQDIYYFSVIAIFILVMAWVNYINLATARAMQRVKEVGIRKSIGAHRNQLISQFMVESLLINCLAAGVAIGIAVLLLPVLNQLVGKEITFQGLQSGEFWCVSFLIVLIGAWLSALYPAFILSSFKPTSIIKPDNGVSKNRFSLRRGLITFQFLISVLLISGTWLVYSQITFMKKQDLGMDIEKIVVINGPRVILETLKEEGETLGSKYQTFKTKAYNHHSISAISVSSHVPGKGYYFTGGIQQLGEPDDGSKLGSIVLVDTNFVKTYDMGFLAKSWVSENPIGKPLGISDKIAFSKGLVINQEAVKLFGFDNPEIALGKRFPIFGDTLKVVGVVENVHWSSPRNAYLPVFYIIDNEYGAYFSIKINLADVRESLDHLKASYHSAFPNDPFYYFFLDDSFNRQYQADRQFGSLFTAFSVLAIFISCLGLFALVSFSASLRTKEIGVRKVLGATVSNLMILLSKEYLILLLIANVLAIPVVFLGGNAWLENYAFRISIGADLVFAPMIVLLVISFLTVSYRTYVTAKANPVKSLRTE